MNKTMTMGNFTEMDIINRSCQMVDIFTNRQYLDGFSKAEIEKCTLDVNNKKNGIRFFKLNRLSLNDKENIQDKLTSVYNAMYNIGSTIAIIIIGTLNDTSLYFATRSDIIKKLAGDTLVATFRGNFPGVQVESLDENNKSNILDMMESTSFGISKCKSLATLSLIPSLKNEEKADMSMFTQGMEKFIDTMQGKEYTAVFLATPISKPIIEKRKRGFEEMYSMLSPYAKHTYSYGDNYSNAVTNSMSRSLSNSTSKSISNSNSSSESYTQGSNSGSSFNYEGWGSSSGSSSSYTSGSSFTRSVSNSVSNAVTNGRSSGITNTEGHSENNTINYENKSISNLMKKIDDQLKRFELCETYGLWENCGYFFSDDVSVSLLASTTYKSIMLGKQSAIEPAHFNFWDISSPGHDKKIKNIMDNIKLLQHPNVTLSIDSEETGQRVTPTSMVSGYELGLLLGVPRKSVKGLPVQSMAEFGRSVVYQNKKPDDVISIGNIYHMGMEDKRTQVELDINMFSSHCFITGSSGSGKSYATYNLLTSILDTGKKMLVIEPAKGEYKTVLGGYNNIDIYTTNVHTYKLLQLNPFEFPETTHILTHIEQLMQIFNASWSLYDAMPAILKDAVVRAYQNCGWDINHSIHITGLSENKYPTFADVLKVLPYIINKSDYSSEVKGNYKGALITRVSSMTSGIIGMMFQSDMGIPDEYLFDRNVIIDLSEIGSGETIALIMGMIIVKLNEYRRSQRVRGITDSHDSGLNHITVLEEAHNILKRVDKGQSQDSANIVGQSVEMIGNSIKEMRTYGEGFVIIDQSPLAIDSSVLENTATKIIMNTPSKDACSELGSALALNEEQAMELSKLSVGVAAVMQKGWMSPVLMSVNKWDYKKYEIGLQRSCFDIEKHVRGMILTEVFNQIDAGKLSLRKLEAIFKNSELNDERKLILSNFVSNFNESVRKMDAIDNRLIGKYVFELSQCTGLLEIAPTDGIFTLDELDEQFNSKSDSEVVDILSNLVERIYAWFSFVGKNLDNYIVLDDKDKVKLLNYIICFKNNDSKKNIYTTISTLIKKGYIS